MFSAIKSNGIHGAYSVGKSLRFRSSASAYLNRSSAATPTNTLKWSLSLWVKRGALGVQRSIIGANISAGYTSLSFLAGDTLRINFNNGTNAQLVTSQVFRDPSAWCHIVLVSDSANATASNRILLYVNGVQVTSFSTANYPALNTASEWNYNSSAQTLGTAATEYFDGYLTEVNFIDGQALTPSSFGAYDTNGVWQPIKYSGSYGTNGFYLPFSNTTSTTTLGYDSSGNGNNWTTNNISLTAGTTYDSMTDSPTVSSASVANYAVINPLNASGGTYQDGDLTWVSPATDQKSALSTIPVTTTGNWYCEITIGSKTGTYWNIGVSSSATAWVLRAQYRSDGATNVNGTTGSTWASYTTGDVIGVAYNSSTGVATFYKNNTSQGNLTVSSLSTTQYFSCSSDGSGGTSTYYVNFGQRPFAYTPPSGFNALNTYNLPAATINNGALYMAATTYTGNGSTQSINNGTNTTIGTTFQPDFVWGKSRSAVGNNGLVNSVVGPNSFLLSNSTQAEITDATVVSSLSSTGFSVGNNFLNTNATTYVAWQWKAAGSTVSNTNGSITSTVSANQTAGFSIATYTGTGANATVGHGLGVAPSMIITKKRSSTSDWGVYHTSIGNTNYLLLDSTAASASSSTYWNNTSPTSSVFSIGTADPVNANTATYVAYCFAAVSGYSAFGSYTGNGSTDGPFVYCGFRPRWVLIKNASSTSNWFIDDTSRDLYNVTQNRLFPSLSNAEATSPVEYDILSNGFKIRIDSDAGTNTNGNTYIYAAFAENPFNYSRAR